MESALVTALPAPSASTEPLPTRKAKGELLAVTVGENRVVFAVGPRSRCAWT